MASKSTIRGGGRGNFGFVPTSSTTFMVQLMFDNYHILKTKIKKILYYQGLIQSIFNKNVMPEGAKKD